MRFYRSCSLGRAKSPRGFGHRRHGTRSSLELGSWFLHHEEEAQVMDREKERKKERTNERAVGARVS